MANTAEPQNNPTRNEDSAAALKPAGKLPEPWLRGSHADMPVLTRAVLHALELAAEDIERWCSNLTDDEVNARPGGIAPVAFHMRHIVRSADRLLTYADGRQLSQSQIAKLKTELDAGATKENLFEEFHAGIESASARVRGFSASQVDEPRKVGKLQLPTSVGSLLIHVADHTQRHVGQAVTTAKIVAASRRH